MSCLFVHIRVSHLSTASSSEASLCLCGDSFPCQIGFVNGNPSGSRSKIRSSKKAFVEEWVFISDVPSEGPSTAEDPMIHNTVHSEYIPVHFATLGDHEASRYHSTANKFERFRDFLELISRFEFDSRRRENYFCERFEFLVRSCESAVARLCPRNSISNVVASVTTHDDIKKWKRCSKKHETIVEGHKHIHVHLHVHLHLTFTLILTHTLTHTHLHMHIHMYFCVCVCVCEEEGEGREERGVVFGGSVGW